MTSPTDIPSTPTLDDWLDRFESIIVLDDFRPSLVRIPLPGRRTPVRGRPLGSGSYAEADEPLVEEMHRLLEALPRGTSVTHVAKLVAHRAAGAGTWESKVDRLRRRYRRKYPSGHGYSPRVSKVTDPIPTKVCMRPRDAADYLTLSPSTLAKMRLRGDGSRYVKAGRAVTYRRADLDAWLGARLRQSTSAATS